MTTTNTATEDRQPATHRACGQRHRPFTPCPVPDRDDDREEEAEPDHDR